MAKKHGIAGAIRGAVAGFRGQLATGQPGTNNAGHGAIRSVPRNKPIGYTIAPPASRQIWELHKIREESRQLALTNPYLRAYCEWAKVHVVGSDLIPLMMDVPRGDRDRLREAAKWWRMRWRRHQRLPLGSRMQNLSELEAQALHHQIVDGDCFVLPYRNSQGRRSYQLYAGDALAETSHIPGMSSRARPEATGARHRGR